jgi:hypothetical protein
VTEPVEAAEDSPVSESEADFAAPFTARSFGGAFVWADAPGYTATVLRVRAGQNVAISSHGRRDMVVMLTGGRAVLEVQQGDGLDHVELLPAAPVAITSERGYRLQALTDVEIFTVYSPAVP